MSTARDKQARAAIRNVEQTMAKARACAAKGDEAGALALLTDVRYIARAIERNGYAAPDTSI